MLLAPPPRGAERAALAPRRQAASHLKRATTSRALGRPPASPATAAAGSPTPRPAAAALVAGRRPPPLAPRVAAVEAPPAAAAPPSAAPDEEAAAAAPAIDWYRQWYPVAAAGDLLEDRPNAIALLGRSLVAWRDAGGAWRVAADACPHRLAQLSEGRVEVREDGTKTLACPYHGWEFDSAGECVRIPQMGELGAPSTSAEDARPRPALAARRSCLTSYPSTVEQGLLWVWADPSSTQAEADASPKCSLEDFRGPDADAELKRCSTTAGWFVRDLPASFEATIENVVDPAHVNFTHHSVQGNRKAEKGTRLILDDRVSQGGFSFHHDVRRPGMPASAVAPPPRVTVRYTSPALVRYDFPFVGRSMCVYVIPTGVGKSRMLARFIKDGPAGGGGGAGAKPPAVPDAPSAFASTTVDGKLKDDRAAAAAAVAAAAGAGASSPPPSSVAAAAAPPPPAPPKPSLARKLAFAVLGAIEARPVLEHALVRNRVLDGDNHIIHVQERQLAAWAEAQEALVAAGPGGGGGGGGGGAAAGAGGDAHPPTGLTLRSWRRGYWMPGEFDVGVQAWRTWLQGPGRKLPTWPRSAADLGPVLSRRAALDRYEQHTRGCKPCRQALERIDARWLPGTALAAAACFAAALWVAGVRAAAALAAAAGGGAGAGAAASSWGAAVSAGAREPVAWALAAAAVAALLARRVALWFRRELTFVDYVHADKH